MKNYKKFLPSILLIVTVLLGYLLRTLGINWDQGQHLHPDERMLIMVADRIQFFSQLNPHFFNYGSLPIYLLKGISQFLDTTFSTHLANYDGMLYVGRVLSALADSLTISVIFGIAVQLTRNKRMGILAAFTYAVAFFPIQNSHFFIVDTFLTLWTSLLLYFTIRFVKNHSFQWIVLMSFCFAAALATKVTASIFLPVILCVLCIMQKPFFPFNKNGILLWIYTTALFISTTLLFHLFFMPYAYIETQTFLKDISEQLKMNSDPYIFPYTRQYVGTLPYWYYVKNIALWGWGPFLFLLSSIGLFLAVRIFRSKRNNVSLFCIASIFYLLYFLVIGRSAVKFMRYMLILYPAMALLAGYALVHINKKIASLVLLGACIWTVSFMAIYSKPNTRVEATNWILEHIPAGSHLAVEHWDDRLPIRNGEHYTTTDLPLYDLPDDERKFENINRILNNSDYIIIASNRLITPLPKLKDCSLYTYCYPRTARYYEDLISGKLGFHLVAEFHQTPRIPILNIAIDDQSADESFTVYDHPKVMIFQKTK
ncbi:phospholipid carrier-dependent glycosyltransferase [Candidatus Roizmanbacteria bacterium]|nr:phospholipid carrier-dependent glycosyltransferase [Candidatus Roizmanbacteria bacterium]